MSQVSPTVNLTDKTYEAQLQAVKADWEHGLFKSKQAATCAYEVSHIRKWFHCVLMLMFQAHVTTLCSQIKGRHCKKEARMSQQLLTKPQEAVLRDWIEFRALIAKPLDEPDIKHITFELSGK
jgi:hypothetical protein